MDSRFEEFGVDSTGEINLTDGNEQGMLTGEIRVGWRLVTPMIIHIELDDDGSFLVSDDEFAVQGDGETRVLAVRDYVDSLIEYYEIVSSHSRQDQQTAMLFRRLRGYLEKVAD